jgi:flagellar biosynthesis anti-sigma factor FlgM
MNHAQKHLLFANMKAKRERKMNKKRKNNAVSPDQAEIQRFKEILKSIPDPQQKKIDEIKKKIDNGEYNVNADDVASKMIELAQDIKEMTPKSKINK